MPATVREAVLERLAFRIAVVLAATAAAAALTPLLGVVVLTASLAWVLRIERRLRQAVTRLESLAYRDDTRPRPGGDEVQRLVRLYERLRIKDGLDLPKADSLDSGRPARGGSADEAKKLDGVRLAAPPGSEETRQRVRFSLEALLAGVTSPLVPALARRGLELILEMEPGSLFLIGDPLPLAQVLSILVGNAIRHSRNGEILLAVKEVSRSQNAVELHFSVRDEGMGLTPRQQSTLFGLFGQGGARLASHDEGMGLAIVARHVQFLGGRIWVESQYGVGTVFHVSGTFSADEGSADDFEADPLKSFRGRRVMVVDDSAAGRRVAGELLVRLGLQPDLYASGSAALSRVTGPQPPDHLLCLIDEAMPGQDGHRVAQLLRTQFGRNCPPLLLLAAGPESLAEGGLAAEFDAVASKPLNREKLVDGIERALRVSAAAKPAGHPPSAAGTLPWLRGKRLLLVGEGGQEQEAIIDALAAGGSQLQYAMDGLEALQAIREAAPDAIITDCRLRAMDAFELVDRLRALGYHRIAVLGIAGASGDREKGLSAGMDEVLERPLQLPTLLQTLEERWSPPGPGGQGPVPAPLPAAACSSPPEGAGELPPLPPGVDVESGLKRLRGQTALFLKALRMFRDSRGLQFQLEIRAAVAARDWPTSERLAHSLRSTAATIGANEVSIAAGALETAIRKGRYGEVPELLADVTGKLRAVVDGLAHIG